MVMVCVERQTAWCRPDWENRKQLKTHSLHIQNILKVVLTSWPGCGINHGWRRFPNIHRILLSWPYFFCHHSNSSNSSTTQTIRKYEQENMPACPNHLVCNQAVMETQLCEKVLEWSRENCGKLGRTRRGHNPHVGDHHGHRYYNNPYQHRQHHETNYPARYYFKTTIVW